MAFVNFAITVSGRTVRLADAAPRDAAGLPDRASVADLTFQQIDLQADVFNTTPIVVSTTPGGPGLLLGPGGAGRITLGPFGSAPLRLVDLYGAGQGVVRVTGVTGAIGPAPTAPEPPAAHHTTHEPGGADAITSLNAGVLTAGLLDPARLPAHQTTHGVGGADAITTLDAAVLTTGLLPDLRLSPNIPRLGQANAFLSTLAERGRTVPLGDWQAVPFAPGNVYSDAGGSWTATSGQIPTQRFALVGQTLHYLVAVVGATVGGGPSALAVLLPPGYKVVPQFTTLCILTVGGVNEIGNMGATVGAGAVTIYRLNGGAYPAGPTSVYFAITVEVTAG